MTRSGTALCSNRSSVRSLKPMLLRMDESLTTRKGVTRSHCISIFWTNRFASKSIKWLIEAIRLNEYHPTTGFWSSTELLLALSGHGAHSEASRMVNTRTMPSWGFMAENGTTFWESFDAINRNQSLCHWTHSGVGEWLWRNVAGLNPDPDDPGYRSMTIRPRPTKEVSSCRARYLSVRGAIEIEWALRGREFRLDITVPVGARAKVFFPVGDQDSIREGSTFAKKREWC